jgi:3-methyladenine DNA glycosylase/8-oxoguanine DNA glycosylase
MAAIHDVLAADAALNKIIREKPGLRLPGAWDPFEAAVRAVVGQQISVKGARTVIGRIAANAGPAFEAAAHPQLTRFFPTADELSKCALDGIGMPVKRIETVKALSRAVAGGNLGLVVKARIEESIAQLTRISGIGDWTAHYIAMRALGEPDAFPAADLGILKALQQGDLRPTPKQVLNRAENWRPWRAYAAIYLWHA